MNAQGGELIRLDRTTLLVGLAIVVPLATIIGAAAHLYLGARATRAATAAFWRETPSDREIIAGAAGGRTHLTNQLKSYRVEYTKGIRDAPRTVLSCEIRDANDRVLASDRITVDWRPDGAPGYIGRSSYAPNDPHFARLTTIYMAGSDPTKALIRLGPERVRE